ncbi:conserved hypothetical protein [Magnetospirillum sp. LM-5]|uniref:DUF3226 domain-containing protein n=1 Tax=Magnetospirillum sp. LM-5 TaxID=2681466 RepID=UPI00137FAD33|nr:DUF3226 domain-containing protein [Magnetospirillum sp. LM-5]CAA7625543.1 conserved hypothetical protein [Magnetospirillum sp. LM-5]
MAAPPRNEARLLIVEGPDDQGVGVAFLNRLGIPAFVRAEGGYDLLRENIPVRIQEPGRAVVGIVVDADQDHSARWQSLADACAKAGIALPPQPDPDGTIIDTPGRPRIGVWLMPDNRTTGILEDFVAFMVPAGDALYPRAEAAVVGLDKFTASLAAKATIHTWLAWQDEPGRPMGQAVTKRFLDPDCPQATIFADWLRRLFG